MSSAAPAPERPFRGTIADVPHLEVGHAEVEGGRSGCTVILGPFRGTVEVRGMATGSRELGTLDPSHVVPQVDAILLTGGAAWGLAAADGVMAWLAERDRGYRTGSGALVPIVPAAVIFDLREGGARPDAALGRAACHAAGREPLPQGRVGAGAGATVGKVMGPGRGLPGGLGSAGYRAGRCRFGALAVVNAVGDVVDRQGRVVAGALDEEGRTLDSARYLREEGATGPPAPGTGAEGAGAGRDPTIDETGPREGENTTLAVVATDAPLSRTDLARVARMAATAVPRRIVPAHTPFDGDITFAVSTASDVEAFSGREILALGSVARDVLEEAILQAVRPVPGPRGGGVKA